MRVTLSRLAMSPGTPPSTLQAVIPTWSPLLLYAAPGAMHCIPTLYTRKQRLQEADSLAQGHAGSKH